MIQDKLVYAKTVRVHYESFGELIPGLALTIQTHLVPGIDFISFNRESR